MACGYVAALAPGVKANCWVLAESAGHDVTGRLAVVLALAPGGLTCRGRVNVAL